MLCAAELSIKQCPIVGILKLIIMINTTSERLKARNFFICPYFSFYEQLKFCAQLSMKKLYNLGASAQTPKAVILTMGLKSELMLKKIFRNGMLKYFKPELTLLRSVARERARISPFN